MSGTSTLLVRFSGDLTTKARGTRLHFLRRLAHNLHEALSHQGVEFRLDRQWSRILIGTDDPRAAEIATRVFGVQSVSPTQAHPWNELGDLVSTGERLFADAVSGRRYAVRARRSGDRRRMPFTSVDLERLLGRALEPHGGGVDLETPEVTAHLEVHAERAYFFTEIVPGPGGLPLAVEGRALALVSGGFDSAAAAWQMMKRGVGCDALFFNLGGDAHRRGVLRVAKLLTEAWAHGDRPRLHEIDFRPIVEELQQRARPRFWQVLLKRQMLRAAERLARRLELPVLVTGDAVGQVSSQTLPNLAVITAACGLPVLRPLLGYNKEEIVALTRRIGTYDLSAEVDEFCAILPRKPATAARAEEIAAEEDKLDPALLERLASESRATDLATLDPARISEPEIEVEAVPDGARVIDLRSEQAYGAWHYPGAERLDYFQALQQLSRFERSASWIFYCEIGLKSADLAERLRERDIEAYNFRGGVRALMEHAREREPLLETALAPALRD